MDLGGGTYSLEKKLTLVALRLAILERAASVVGTLGFIWATVVLLGGFVAALELADFYFVTAILLVERAQIFSRNHELERLRRAPLSFAEVGVLSFRASLSFSRSAARAFLFLFSPSGPSPSIPEPPDAVLPVTVKDCRWELPELPGFSSSKDLRSSTNPTGGSPESPNVHPCTIHLFKSSSMSSLIYWLQLFSATACAFLSSMRLAQQNYGDIAGVDESTKRNLRPALNIFYSLSLAKALILVAKRAYLEWKLRCCLLLEKVHDEFGLELTTVRRFFYEAYSRSINESIFDGRKMDMASFGKELLVSGSSDKQLIGAKILLTFADKAKRKNGVEMLNSMNSDEVEMKRLVEMLNWRSSGEEGIRAEAAAVVVSRLVRKKWSAIRLTEITGAMKSIASLLNNENYTSPEKCHKFNLLGLLILKRLAKDPDNCVKISKTKNLISKIIDFSTTIIPKLQHQNPIAGNDSEIKAAKRALEVLKRLAGTTGRTRETLRREISGNITKLSNILKILNHCSENETLKLLEKLVWEIITLGMDEAAELKA